MAKMTETPKTQTPAKATPPHTPDLTVQDCLDVLAEAVKAKNPGRAMGIRVAAATSLLQWQAHQQQLHQNHAMMAGRPSAPGRIVSPGGPRPVQ